MISAATIYGVSGLGYLLGLVAVGLYRDRFPATFERSYRVVALVLGVGAATSAMMVAGLGSIPFGASAIDLPTFVNDLVAYPLLWYVAARLGGASKRLTAVVTGLPFAQVLAFQLGATTGGLVGLLSSLFVIGGHLVLAYLFFGPIWRHAQALPDERRLLHWKARNLLLFLIGMLIVYAFLSLAGAFTVWATLVINQYIAVLIRVGFAGFLLVNVGALTSTTGVDAAGAVDVPGHAAPDVAE